MNTLRSSSHLSGEDLRFQRKQWLVERIGWAAMAVVLACALAGALGGSGPLSNVAVPAADSSIRAKYERFARLLGPTTLEISVAQSSSGQPVQLHVSENYLNAMSLQSITPQPYATTLANQFYIFAFNRLPAAAETTIRLHLEPQAIGSIEGRVAVDNGAPLLIKHFIFP